MDQRSTLQRHLLEKVTILADCVDVLDGSPMTAFAVIAKAFTSSSKEYSSFDNQHK